MSADDDPIDEFQAIADLFAPLAKGYDGALALTDDVALIGAAAGDETAVTVDAMVSGVHFLPDDPPDLVARKLVRVNLSDLAAKGTVPFAVMLAAAFPVETRAGWLKRFVQGLGQDLAAFGVALIGGDTVSTPGPLTLSLTAFGRIAKGRAVLRSGARPGDTIWVSGTLGDGALGLAAAQGRRKNLSAEQQAFLTDRYRLPQPRLALGQGLPGLAHAAMDISDGLVQDLGHLCHASHVSGEIWAARLPLSDAARSALAQEQSLLASILTGGDDYELLFTAPAAADEAVQNLGRATGVTVSAIGSIGAGQGVSVRDLTGQPLHLTQGGWRHFSATGTGAGA